MFFELHVKIKKKKKPWSLQFITVENQTMDSNYKLMTRIWSTFSTWKHEEDFYHDLFLA